METEYTINGRPRKTWWYRLYLKRLCFKSFWTSHKTAPISSHNYIRQWSIWFRGVDQGHWAWTPRIRCSIYLWLKKHIHEKSCSWICCWEHWGTWFVEIGWIISSCDIIGLWKHGAFHCQIHISWSKLPDFIQSTSFKIESIEIQVNTKAATRQGLSWTPYPESKLSSVHTTELRQTRCTTFANWKWMVSWKWNM